MRAPSRQTRETHARAGRPATSRQSRARGYPLGCSCAAERLQAKPRLGRSGDAAEREADRAAARVLAPGRAGAPRIAPVAPAAASAEPARAAETAVEALHGPGAPLTPAERAYFEPRFGRNLGAVRLHDTPATHAAASAIGARAYAVGADIGFARGLRRPDAPEGRRLLSHEIAHTLQQGAGPAPGSALVQREEGRPNLETPEGRQQFIDQATGPFRWLAPMCAVARNPVTRWFCRLLLRAAYEVPRDVQRNIVEPYHERIERESNPNR